MSRRRSWESRLTGDFPRSELTLPSAGARLALSGAAVAAPREPELVAAAGGLACERVLGVSSRPDGEAKV